MAITQASLKAKIKANIIALYGGGNNPDDDDTLDKFCNAIAKSVVDEIHQNAEVEIKSGNLTVAPGSFSAGVPVSGVGQVNPGILPATCIL